MKRMELLSKFEEVMTAEGLLEAIVRQMSDDEAVEAFEYIDRMYDTGVMDEEDEE